MKRIILASGSPRRKQLLEQAELVFEVKAVPTEEHFPPDMPSAEVAEYIAKNKAAAVLAIVDKADDVVVIAADTVVVLEAEILGKPADAAAAIAMLSRLSGKTHQVITGVVLQDHQQTLAFSSVTSVFINPLSPEQIHHYVTQYQPLDKAGAYAIQEWIGLIGISHIEGDYYNVMGLPVSKVIAGLQQFIK